jgi:hypothetical protein
MNAEQLEALYGPLFPHSDHKIGQTVRFYDVVLNQELEGVIEWIQAPGSNYEGGTPQPVSYILDIVDKSTGMPYTVFPSDIVVR